MPSNELPRAYSYVRMSTPEQRKGDSFRRQISASARYAERHGLQLVEGNEAYEDIGVSAFKGKNVKSGALGRFLEAVRSGTIARGSYLLVESLDRVSRQTPYDASATMRDIVDEGVNVVDLSDNDRLYNTTVLREDTQSYMRMVVRFERAHDESKTKSERVKEAWSAKRLLAKHGTRKMTTWCPAWLRLSKDRTSYETIDKNAKAVRWIFNEAAEGRGIFAITRRLNEQKLFTPFGKSKGWHPSYVIKILKNKATIGIYQPTKIRGHAATEQDLAEHSITGYYPAIIDEELFFRVQRGLTDRRSNGGGRKGVNFTNLFTGLKLICAYCGGPIRFENKGSGPKGGHYFVCDGARRQYNCDAQRWPYQHFEDSFLSFVHHELDFSTLQGNHQSSQAAALDRSIEALRGQIGGLVEQRVKRINLIDKGVDEDVVIPLVKQLTGEIKEAEERLTKVSQERQDLAERIAVSMNGPHHLAELIDSLKAPEADRYAVRSRLAKLIRGLVSEIAIAAKRPADGTFGPMEWARNEREIVDAGLLLTRLFRNSDVRTYYVVRLKDDSFNVDVPPADPLAHPLSSEETEAWAFLFDDGWIQVVEADKLDAFWDDPDDRKISIIWHMSTSSRAGHISRKQPT